MRKLIFLLLIGSCFAQVPVVLAPLPKLQFFDQTGKPLAFGCVSSFQSGTVTPLATYTDSTGTIQNTNPVILSAGGSANIWLAAGSNYTLILKSAGGTNCALGTTQYTVNGIGAGTTQQITPVTPSGGSATFPIQSQNELFTLTLTGNVTGQPLSAVGIVPPAFVTFQITQDAVGGHTFSWPANAVGGTNIASGPNQVTQQTFLWAGSTAYSVAPAIIEVAGSPYLSVNNIVASGFYTGPDVVSATANPAQSGFVRLASPDSIAWRNNANGADLFLGKSAADNLTWPNGLSLGLGSPLATTNQTGTGNLVLQASPTINSPTLVTPNLGVASATSLACPVNTQSTNYTLTTSDCVVHITAAGGSLTATLPSEAVGQLYVITRTDSVSSNSVTIVSDIGQVNNAASIKLPVSSTAVCHSGGTNGWCSVSTIPSSNNLTQSTRLTGSAITFTYPVAFSSTPTCVCSGEGGSCNVSSVSTTQCTLNITVATNDVIVTGIK